MVEEKFIVEGMGCANCVKKVKKALKQLEEVKSIKVDLDSGNVSLKCTEQINKEKLQNIIEEIGYKVNF